MVPDQIRECAARGIRGVIIESGGFAETGKNGAALQEDIKAIARENGVRLWGPNCMGLVDAVRKYVFSFASDTIWNEGFVPGNVSLIVQSGMLSGVFLIDAMTHGTLDISKVCSIGNKSDVDECDLLEYLIKDPDTKAVGLYLESFANGRRFTEICRRSKKPIVLLRGGKSEKGAKAAMSHTASLAGNGGIISGAMSQIGVLEADDFKQMMDMCRALAMFSDLPIQDTGRIAVLTYSGGAGIVSSDFIEAAGLELADFSQTTRERMQTVSPEWMPVSNPADLWPAVEQNGVDKAFGTAIRAACADPRVDAIFIHVFVGGFALNPDIVSLSAEPRAANKPMFCFLLGEREEARGFHITAHKLGVAVFRDLSRCVECMKALFDFKKSVARRKPDAVPSSAISLPSNLLASQKGSLDEHLSKKILSAFEIPVVEEKIADSLEDAQKTASEYGFPVVMKGLLPGEVHKTEHGLVCLGIHSAQAVQTNFESMNDRMKGRGKILIQKQIKGELELIAGMVRDPQFGLCVMCGFGGILAEVIGDAAFAMAPLSSDEALDMISRLRSSKLLDGFRGAPPADRNALAQILVRLGELGQAYSQIREIDINPLIVSSGGPVAADASVIL